MTSEDNLGCGHCGRPLDICNCGVDRDLVYREAYREQVSSSVRGWVALALGLGAVMALRVAIFGW